MARGGRVKASEEPERRCIVTRETGPKAGLIRFVVGPGDEVVPDLAGRLPGRGMWVKADASALGQAAGKGYFARAAKRQLSVPRDLAATVERQLAARLVELIALARKAGDAVAGFEKAKEALVSGQAALLLQAADGSERERGRLRPPEGENTLVSCLFGHELGLAFARDRVIHAAVLAGGLGDRIRDEALRLSGIRGGTTGLRSTERAGDGSAEDGLREKENGNDGYQGQ
ncbi:MAG: RNA-binding protein [Amaricoccus sp.]